jgi:hypothetical protein
MHGQKPSCREQGEEGSTNPEHQVQTEMMTQIKQNRQAGETGKGRVPPERARDYVKVSLMVV